MTDWFAAALGLAGGLGLAWWIAGAALPRLMERSRWYSPEWFSPAPSAARFSPASCADKNREPG